MDPAAQQLLGTVRVNLSQVIAAIDAAVPAGAPEPLSAWQKMELWTRAHHEAGDYNRHYSATRSGLTILLVTVGLGAAWQAAPQLPSGADMCALQRWKAVFDVAMVFAIPILLFACAIVVNLHFQRFTVACELIQREIERRMAAEMHDGDVPAAADQRTQDIACYAFRHCLEQVRPRLRPVHFDLMATLLLIAIFAFFGLVMVLKLSACLTVIQGLLWVAVAIITALVVAALLTLFGRVCSP